MTVYEVIQQLVTMPADATVIVRIDAPNDLLKDYMSEACGVDSESIDDYCSDLSAEVSEWKTVKPDNNPNYCYLNCDLCELRWEE